MNEKITLLALKASDPKTGWLDRQKFAELILAECIKILADNSEFRSCVIIGKHFRVFGVEE